jgi:hypothetical protein
MRALALVLCDFTCSSPLALDLIRLCSCTSGAGEPVQSQCQGVSYSYPGCFYLSIVAWSSLVLSSLHRTSARCSLLGQAEGSAATAHSACDLLRHLQHYICLLFARGPSSRRESTPFDSLSTWLCMWLRKASRSACIACHFLALRTIHHNSFVLLVPFHLRATWNFQLSHSIDFFAFLWASDTCLTRDQRACP